MKRILGMLGGTLWVLVAVIGMASPAWSQSTGTLQGTVTENGSSLLGARIDVFGPQSTTTFANLSGFYSLNLTAGGYNVVIRAPDNIVIFRGDAIVSTGQTLTVDANLTRGTITGSITENGAPLFGAGVAVFTFNTGNPVQIVGNVYTASVQSIAAGIVVTAPDGVIIGRDNNIAVVAGQTQTLNFDLQRARMSGTVIDGGVPLQGATILDFTFNTGNPPQTSDLNGKYTSSLQSNVGIDHIVLRPNGTQLCRAFLSALTPGQTLQIVNCTPVFNVAPVADAGPDQTLVCSAPAGCAVTLDGSASTDADSATGTNDDIATFDWFEFFGTPSQTLIATGDQVSVNLAPGVHTISLEVTDTGGLSDTDEVVVTVKSPAEATQDLINAVIGLGLPRGIETSLTSKLNAAVGSFNTGNTTAAVNQLGAFINEVNALVKSGKLSTAQGAALIADAQEIIGAV